jgi:outer membrane receptor protein involved in Fe transport
MQSSGRLQDLSTGSLRTSKTDAGGTLVFGALPFSTYRLDVSAPGFLSQSLRVDVRSTTPVKRTLTLSLAGAQGKVDVVATMPLPGVEISPEQIASPVQTASAKEIAQTGAIDLTDFLRRRFNGVQLNEVQGNPFQPDLNYRGYTASPLLGTPQGLSVYMDGVRLNEPFGDVVSWDLIPRNAISSVTLMPGSNPLFGLNTLGGALSVQTKDGVTNHDTSAQLTYGSSGRKALEFEHGGGKATGLNWFFTGNLFHESGWRFDSPSDVRQGFGKVGWRTGKTDLSVNSALAYNALRGNGLQEQRFLLRDWSSVYTIPDITRDRSPFLNVIMRHTVTENFTLTGNAYFRYIRADTVNGNLNTNSLDQQLYQPNAAEQAALKAAGYTGYPSSGATSANTPYPKWRCIAQALLRDEPAEKCNGLTNHSLEAQNNYGFAGQATHFASRGPVHSQFTAGGAFTGSVIDFTQSTQLGYLNPDRSITSVDAFGDGTSNVDGVPFDDRVNLHGRNSTWSLYATDTLSIGNAWNVTLSGRYNRNTVQNRDRIQPQGGPGSLNGNNVYGRFNPAIGVTWSPNPVWNVFVSYTQGSRAPTSVELGCADPENPCSLPNALAGDPPLRQVSTDTWEAGLRGKSHNGVSWSASGFRSENRNDILFVASQVSGSGYFRNFGKTLRQGAEASLQVRVKRITAGAGYTFLDATYQTAETVAGTGNSTNDAALSGLKGIPGVIQITPGDHIPLVPQHNFKIFGDIEVTRKLSVDVDLLATSGSYARGNENNLDQPDGKYYLGPGKSPGYVVVNLRAHYDLTRRFQLAAQIDNLFDRRYYTAAQLGATGFNDQGTFVARPFPAYANGDYPVQQATFYAPGAPRRAWVELKVRF